MGIEKAIVSKLKATTAVTNLLGSGDNFRFYAIQIPTSNKTKSKPTVSRRPAATYQTISSPKEYTNKGSIGLRRTRIQIDVISNTYASAKSIADAIETALDFIHEKITVDSVIYSIKRVFIIDTRDIPVIGGIGKETTAHGVLIDLEIEWSIVTSIGFIG